MHWILNHRKGLRMRYHVHEVLDIGEQYTYRNLNWVIKEIEKPGTWHNTVGHGSSMSSKRFLFDLSLLNKDLIEYGHDSHTHYYLGVTYEAVATALYQTNGSLSMDIIYHYNQAIKYLQMRIESSYPREFVEDRFNCMLLLGNIYSNILVRLLLIHGYCVSLIRYMYVVE